MTTPCIRVAPLVSLIPFAALAGLLETSGREYWDVLFVRVKPANHHLRACSE